MKKLALIGCTLGIIFSGYWFGDQCSTGIERAITNIVIKKATKNKLFF